MNTIGENSIINTYGVTNENIAVTKSAINESKITTDDTAAILNLSEDAFGDGVVTVKSTASTRVITYTEIVNAQNCLRTLGFYEGSNTGYVSDDMKKSITNFQKVYGMTETGSLTDEVYSKIVEVNNKFSSIYNSGGLSTIVNNNSFDLDNDEKKNFALIWTFLDKSMGLTGEQIVGVMANIHAESRFSSDNLQGTNSDHDTSYVFSAGDGKGYGILQWTDSARKNHLLSTTYSMGLEVSDINAQLAYFRKEMTTVLSGVDYVEQWENLKATENYIDACDVFMEEIECPEVNNYDEREGFAVVIYNAMKKEFL